MNLLNYLHHLWNRILIFVVFLLDLDLAENPVSDKRLLKLIQQCRTKQVLDYVKQHGENAPKSVENNSNPSANQKSKSKKSKKSESSDEPKFLLNVKRHADDTVKVKSNVLRIFQTSFIFNKINNNFF